MIIFFFKKKQTFRRRKSEKFWKNWKPRANIFVILSAKGDIAILMINWEEHCKNWTIGSILQKGGTRGINV